MCLRLRSDVTIATPCLFRQCARSRGLPGSPSHGSKGRCAGEPCAVRVPCVMFLAMENRGLAAFGNGLIHTCNHTGHLDFYSLWLDILHRLDSDMSSPASPISSNFPQPPSRVIRSSEEFAANVSAWEVVLEKYDKALELASSEGSDAAVKKHTDRGQLQARRRISLLLDEQSPFLELGAFAGNGNEDSTIAASLITGIGLVNNVMTMIIAHIPSINGGAWNEFTVKKQNRVTEIATLNKLPIIALVQSAGIFLPLQFRVFNLGGHIFRDLARRTAEGNASCAVVFGSSTAGGAYHPALSDYSIFVKNQARVFLGAPPLVKMATGEVVGAEDLGGAEMHAAVTGLADQLATDE